MTSKRFFSTLFIFHFLTIHAQQSSTDQFIPDNPDYHVIRYNSENGLPQNSVNDLLLDKNHFLWIATQNGLVRFDGQRFRIYNTSNTPLLRTNRFPVISQTTNGRVLIKSVFDDSVIYTVTPNYHIVKDTASTHLQKKLISFHSNGIFNFDTLLSNAHTTGMDTAQETLLYRLSNSLVYWILSDHEAVISLDHDYYFVDNAAMAVRKFPRKWESTEQLQQFFIGDIFCIARNNGELLFYKNGISIDIQTDPSVISLLKGYRGLSAAQFFLHSKGGYTILRRHNDFYDLQISGNALKAQLLCRNLGFLENQSVFTLQYDSVPKRLFMGTQNAGLFVITPNLFHTLTFKTPDYINNVFMAIQLLPGAKIVSSAGVMDIAGSQKNILFQSTDKIDRNCIYRALDKGIWCSKNKFLYRYDSSFSKPVLMDSSEMESIMTGMTEQKGPVYWISTLSSLMEIKEGKLRYLLKQYPLFINHTIESIISLSTQKLWIATRNGLYEYDLIREKINPKPLIADTYVRQIFRATDGSIWIGTYGSGYFKYWKGHFRQMPGDPENYLATAHSFLEDGKGYFWISTNHGLFRILKSELDSIADGSGAKPFMYFYDKSYGFRTNEFNGGCNPAALDDGQGKFYFPSMNGVVYFRPENCQPELPDKPLYVDGIQADSSRLDYDNDNNLQLDPDFTHLIVQVSTPFYGSPENLRLEYSLSPDAWYPVSRDGQIVLNRLASGQYTLKIRKLNGWGKEQYSTTGLSFKVLYHWYNHPVFLIAIWGLLLWVGIMLTTRILRRQNIRLQMKVDERTFELEKSTVIKEKMLSVIMHDLQSPLYAQNLLIKKLHQQFNQSNPTDTEHLFAELLESGKTIAQFSADFLTWYDTQKGGFTLQKAPLHLLPFISSLMNLHRQQLAGKAVSLEYEVPESLVVNTDKQLLAIVIRNIVDNSIKHTQSGSIWLKVFALQESVNIEISDTGKGLSQGQIRELLSPSITGDNRGYAFGFRFIREFTQLLGGILAIESEHEAGTKVTISLPNPYPV